MSKVMKIVTILMIMLMVVSISTSVFANNTPSVDNFIKPPSGTDNSALENISGSIVSTISTIGVVLSIVVLMVLGIKYMIGSTEEKAEYKKTFIPYLVGAVLIFAGSSIAQLVINFASGITV